ncbi:hypothetical protein JXA12_05485 [Candidatus Woesearchaeota archaeon]|nr:hypothetical protein [Candidatus Woesearchaeota archaeon]
MKQVITFFLLITMSTSFVSADVTVPGTKAIDYCTRITNADSFPDYYIVGVVAGPMNWQATILHDNECFGIGYKFNSGAYYAVKKTEAYRLDEINLAESDWREAQPALERLINEGVLEPIPIKINRVLRTKMTNPKTGVTDTHTLTLEDGVFTAKTRRTTTYAPRYIALPIISLIAIALIILELRRRKRQ